MLNLTYAPEVTTTFPTLVSAALLVHGITPAARLEPFRSRWLDTARARLAHCRESDLAEIQAWREAFSRMGLRPTQYRCAAEALLRRFRTDGDLPEIHPLVDLCNAASLAYAIPVAPFDTAHIRPPLQVRRAAGMESFTTLSGAVEHPEPGEVVFADAAGIAHARRWTHRQGATSCIRADTTAALIVIEALHPTALHDVESLRMELCEAIRSIWPRSNCMSLNPLTASADGRHH